MTAGVPFTTNTIQPVPAEGRPISPGSSSSSSSSTLRNQHQHGDEVDDEMAIPFLQAIFQPNASQNYQAISQAEQGGNGMLSPRQDKRFDDKPPSLLSAGGDEHNACSSLSRWRISPRMIADATIGLSDGLTVPFALTAGLSALGDTNVVIYGGLAELIAGGISMGLGGYLGARSEAEAYRAALADTRAVVARRDERQITQLIQTTFAQRGPYFSLETTAAMAADLLEQPDTVVLDFLMTFHHGLAENDFAASRAWICGATISAGYFLGGLVPLLPYLFFDRIEDAFVTSILVMAAALFVFGWLKTSLVGERSRLVCAQNAVQMTVLGGIAAAAAVGCVKAIG